MKIDSEAILWLIMFLPSLTVHEFMHAFAAYKLGDPTAKNAGRMTLDPLAHIDPFGTIILPLVLALTSGMAFGYAKPVPYNPGNFKNVRTGDLLVAVAGPAGNLVLALLGAAMAWGATLLVGQESVIARGVVVTGIILAQVNLTLMFFNLLPIPPLDGSSILMVFLPDGLLPMWYRIQRYSFPILFVLLFLLPMVLNVYPLESYFNATVGRTMAMLGIG